MESTNRRLLRLHVEAVWGVQLPSLILHTHDFELLREGLQPSWKLFVADVSGVADGDDITGDRVNIWRPDVDRMEREALLARANEAMVLSPTVATAPGISREVALHQTALPALDVATSRKIARPLTALDQPLLEAFYPDAANYFSQTTGHVAQRPLVGIVIEGRLLCLAHSSRRTSEACELGVDTLPEARRRGYSLAATVLWAEMVAQEGLVPLYSALAENTASLRLAAAAGYRVFARAATIEE
jgi:GNAT acetyltransferase